MNRVNATKALMSDLKKNQPDFYELVVLNLKNKQLSKSMAMQGLGADDKAIEEEKSGFFNISAGDILAAVKDTANTVYAYKKQKDLIDLNVKRADQGLAPIDSSAVAPTVKVDVGSSQIMEALNSVVQKYGIYIALGLGGILFYKMKGKK